MRIHQDYVDRVIFKCYVQFAVLKFTTEKKGRVMTVKKVAGRSGIKYKKRSSESWICSACKKEGTVRTKAGISIEKVLERMLAQHQLKSPNCSDNNVELKNKAFGLFLSWFC